MKLLKLISEIKLISDGKFLVLTKSEQYSNHTIYKLSDYPEIRTSYYGDITYTQPSFSFEFDISDSDQIVLYEKFLAILKKKNIIYNTDHYGSTYGIIIPRKYIKLL